MGKTKYSGLILLGIILPLLAGCGVSGSLQPSYSDPNKSDLMLHLPFDEGSGNKVNDASHQATEAVVSYALASSPTLPGPLDPTWRDNGVVGKALLFDGYSTWISYQPSAIKVRGSHFSISAWVAPRAYDWDDTDAIANDNEYLTGVASQYYRDSSMGMGFILGYRREGAWSFQVGTGNQWHEVWDEGTPLKKYEWNQITATFDGPNGRIAIYLNGRIVNQKTIESGSQIMFSDMPLLIGKSNVSRSSGSASQGVVSGLMDDLRMYKKALSSANVRDYFDFFAPNGTAPELAFSDIWLQNVLTEDAYKTQFHGGPYQHWMNEPHAPIYYMGVYHLFFQFNILGPYFNNAAGIAWGHLVSLDMVAWKPIKEAIVPTAGTVAPDGIWSGGSTYGSFKGYEDVPVLLFTAGDYKHQGLISNQNVGLATPKDPSDPYLTEWEVSDRLAIRQTAESGFPHEFRDANIWIEGDTYYLVIGSRVNNTARGCALLYTTSKTIDDPFHNWTYRGIVYDWPEQTSKYGSTWELPVLLPLKNANGQETGKYIMIISPAPATTADNNIVYWIGDFNKTTYRFIPDVYGEPTRMDYGRNVFTGPSGFIDPISGHATIFSIMQDQRPSAELAATGWAHCVGLPRVIYLDNDGQLVITTTENTANIKNPISQNNTISFNEANTILSNNPHDMFYLKITFSNISSNAIFGIRVRKSQDGSEYTSVYFDATIEHIGINTRLNRNNSGLTDGDFHGYLAVDGTLTIEIYVDRSLIEAFFNQHKTISSRSYPEDMRASGIELFTQAGTFTITNFELASMSSIYEVIT